MDKKVISELLEKYYSGLSSLEEEKTLKKAFTLNPELMDDFPEGAIFAFINEEGQKSTKVELPRLEKRNIWSPNYYRWAATILLGLGLSWGMWSYNQSQQSTRITEIEDPELALIETKKALAMVSEKLNHGKTQAAIRVKKYNEMTPVQIP